MASIVRKRSKKFAFFPVDYAILYSYHNGTWGSAYNRRFLI